MRLPHILLHHLLIPFASPSRARLHLWRCPLTRRAARAPSRQVFDRLYAQAEATRSKKEALAVKHEEDVRAQIESQRENISWVSRELTAGR